MTTTKTLGGVIAAITTAIDDKGEPDSARSTTLARFLLANGCDGLNVLGTTGEATSFSVDQRKRVMSAYAASGLPLDRMMVGTGAAALADAIALTRHAAELGFAGALVPAFAEDAPVTHQHAADTRIRLGRVEAARREFQSPTHVAGVALALGGNAVGMFIHDFDFKVAVSPGNSGSCSESRCSARRRRWCRKRSTSSRNASASWKLRYTDAKRT